MHEGYAKWEIKTSVFSEEKPPPGNCCRNINSHTRYRVRQWLCAKFQEPGQGKKRFSDPYLHQKLGLHQLSGTKQQRFVCERV